MNHIAKLYYHKAKDLENKLNLLNEELSHLAEAMTEEERLEKQSSDISKRLAAISQKDPSQLTSWEASQLMIDKIMMQGGSTSQATKGLAAKVEQKLRSQVLDREVDPTINQQQRDIENIERIPGILSSTVGRDFEDLRQATQTAMARERRPKAQPQTQSPVASSQQNEAQPYESLRDVPGVEISADTPDWVIRWAKKLGDDPRKIEAMRLGVQSALGGDPTQPMNPKLTAAQVGKLGVKLDRDRTNYRRAKEKYKKENELAGFEGLSAPERQAPIQNQPKYPAQNPVATEPADMAPLPKTGAELNAERSMAKAIGANQGYNLNRIVDKLIQDKQVKDWNKAQDREKTREIYSTREDEPLSNYLDQIYDGDTQRRAKTVIAGEDEYRVVPATGQEVDLSILPEPTQPRIIPSEGAAPLPMPKPSEYKESNRNKKASTQSKVRATNLEKLKHQLELYGRDVSDFIKIQLMTPNLWSDSEKLYGDLYGSNKGSANPDIQRGGYDPTDLLDVIKIPYSIIPEPIAHSIIKKNMRKKRFSKESDALQQTIDAAKQFKDEYPVVAASPDEGRFEEIPEPSLPRVVKQNYSRPFDDFIPKLSRSIPKSLRPSASKQPTATQAKPIVINTGGMNTPMSLEDEPEEAPKAKTGISRKMRDILDRLALDNISPADLKKVLDNNPQLKKLFQKAAED